MRVVVCFLRPMEGMGLLKFSDLFTEHLNVFFYYISVMLVLMVIGVDMCKD